MAYTFAQIKTEVLALVIDTPSAIQTYVPVYVNRAVLKIQKKHNFKFMEATKSYLTINGQRALNDIRPLDWKESRGKPYFQRFDGSVQEIDYVSTEAEALARFGNDVTLDIGEPQLLFENDLPQEFDVYPYTDGLSDYTDGQYRIIVPYWKFLPALNADNDTNWVTNFADEYVVAQAVANAYRANVDTDMADQWEIEAARKFLEAVSLDKSRRLADVDVLVPYTGAKRPHTVR